MTRLLPLLRATALSLLLSGGSGALASSLPVGPVTDDPMSRTEAAMRAQLWTHAYNEDQPEHFVISVAPTGSMKPTFDEHSLLVVRRLTAEQVKVGDIILFETPNEKFRDAVERVAPQNLICHRVVKVVPGGFQTKGDNNGRTDPWVVTATHLRGVVAGIMFFDPRATDRRDHRVAATNPYLPSAKLVQRLLAERAPPIARAAPAAKPEHDTTDADPADELPPTPVAAAAVAGDPARG